MRSRPFSFIALFAAATLVPAVELGPDCALPLLGPQEFSELLLDYIVIGSGAGGLTVAARLSENPNVHVGLIEAGIFHYNDPLIEVPAYGGQIFGNPNYDWLFETVPQAHAAGRIIQEIRGKMLGGSTGINLMAWDRASKLEYDSWQSFANDSDWNFDNLLPYFIKSETVNLSNNDVFPGVSKQGYAIANQEFKVQNGFQGPIHASYNQIYGDLALPLATTWNGLGVPTNPNTIGGNSSGVRNERTAVFNGVRSYSATGHYCPASRRPNFHVLTGAQATKLIFGPRNGPNDAINATGVSFVSNGTAFIANALKEVILAAGSVQTPQLLELSGIGNKSILSNLGIETLIDLPGVGTNLQDHIYTVAQWVALPNITTFDPLRYNATFLAEQTVIYNNTHTGFLNTRDSNLVFLTSNHDVFPKSDVQELISELNALVESNDSELTPLQRAQYNIQLTWLKDGSVAQGEFIAQSNGLVNPADDTNYMCILSGLMHPLSRGTIHITSTDPLAHPAIDPNYLSFNYDLLSLQAFANISVTVSQHQPISNLLVKQEFPPPGADLASFVISSFSTGDHLAGTAAMASQELGGVVDSNLKVYGTSNVRIVDASIMPLIVGAHLQATVYAIGEKAADIIKSGR